MNPNAKDAFIMQPSRLCHPQPIPLQLIVRFHAFAPNLFEETSCQPFLEPSVHRTAASVLAGQDLPLTATGDYFVEIVNREVITRAFVLYDILFTENAVNFILIYCTRYFLTK